MNREEGFRGPGASDIQTKGALRDQPVGFYGLAPQEVWDYYRGDFWEQTAINGPIHDFYSAEHWGELAMEPALKGSDMQK